MIFYSESRSTEMIFSRTLSFGVQFVIPVAGIADNVARLDVEQVCDAIAHRGVFLRLPVDDVNVKKDCLEGERTIRDELVKQWPNFSAADKAHCVNETVMGGESSYTELIICLEMARDLKAIRDEEQGAVSGTSKPTTGGARPLQ
jgi:hypothetical protein